MIEKCKSAPKQSVETHSAWYLIPPQGTEGVNWEVFPEDVEFAQPDGNGFRGFIVEFYNVISGEPNPNPNPQDSPLPLYPYPDPQMSSYKMDINPF